MAGPKTRLTPKKKVLGIGGVALFGTGGCLMGTIILIPLALPLAMIGAAMTVGSLFVKTEPLECPACRAMSKVEPQVQAAKCPHCGSPLKREGAAWVRVV
jgi:hypothetical protein